MQVTVSPPCAVFDGVWFQEIARRGTPALESAMRRGVVENPDGQAEGCFSAISTGQLLQRQCGCEVIFADL